MLKKLLIIFGGFLVTVSLTIFCAFSMLVYQIIYEPEQVSVLRFIAGKMPQTNEVISGTINESNFVIQASEPFRLVFCFMVITFCLYVLVGIFRVIMMAGLELIKLGTSLVETEQNFDSKF
jgi:hypothetical protein